MKLAVISDLHLGAGDLADGFGHDDGDFLRFLTFLERNFERVILLGDIWETLQSRRLGSAREELLLARATHPEIARRFELVATPRTRPIRPAGKSSVTSMATPPACSSHGRMR